MYDGVHLLQPNIFFFDLPDNLNISLSLLDLLPFLLDTIYD